MTTNGLCHSTLTQMSSDLWPLICMLVGPTLSTTLRNAEPEPKHVRALVVLQKLHSEASGMTAHRAAALHELVLDPQQVKSVADLAKRIEIWDGHIRELKRNGEPDISDGILAIGLKKILPKELVDILNKEPHRYTTTTSIREFARARITAAGASTTLMG